MFLPGVASMESVFSCEFILLKKILYKNKNQHKHSIYYRHLLHVGKFQDFCRLIGYLFVGFIYFYELNRKLLQGKDEKQVLEESKIFVVRVKEFLVVVKKAAVFDIKR